MATRIAKVDRKVEDYIANIDTIIERLKKARALNCNPSDVGMDGYGLKRLLFNRLNVLKKIF